MRKNLTIILFLFTVNFNASSQDVYTFSEKPAPQKIDSLKKKLLTLKNSERIDCLNEISEVYLTHLVQDADTSKVYARQALKEAEKINYIRGMAKAYKNLGRIESILVTDLPSAEKYFSVALSLFMRTGDDQQIALSWANLGYAKWVLCKFPEAMEAYKKAVDFFLKKGDTDNLAITYEFISFNEIDGGRYGNSLEYAFKRQDLTGEENYDILGHLYEELGEYETALGYFQKMSPSGRGVKYLFIGRTFYLEKKYDSAFYYYQLFSNYAKLSGEGELSKLYSHLGELYFALKDYDIALLYLNDALKMHKKATDINQVMRVLLILGKTYKEKKDYTRAMLTVQELLHIADRTGALQYSRDGHFLLSQLFEYLQKQDSAYRHLRQFTILKDSIDLDVSAQKLAFYKIKSERETSQASIKLLNDEKKLQQQQLQKEALIKKILVAGLIVFVVIGISLFRNIALKRKNERLESERTKAELQQQATELEMQALRAQMNPHFIFNCLNAINGFILTSDSETAADYLTKFSRLIRMVLNNSQKKFISLDEELETLDLYLYMENLRFTNNFHYRINCDDTIDALSIFIPPMLLQPFAENAVWHGLMHKEGNGELNIDLHLENNILHCTITDNGVGRKKAAMLKSKSAEKNKSMGLQITKNRMALLNGDLKGDTFFEVHDLEDEDGNAVGTRVSLKIKIRETAEENVSENLPEKITDQ